MRTGKRDSRLVQGPMGGILAQVGVNLRQAGGPGRSRLRSTNFVQLTDWQPDAPSGCCCYAQPSSSSSSVVYCYCYCYCHSNPACSEAELLLSSADVRDSPFTGRSVVFAAETRGGSSVRKYEGTRGFMARGRPITTFHLRREPMLPIPDRFPVQLDKTI